MTLRNAARAARVDALVKKIGFLSFGHWSASPGSQTRTASDALLQSIDLAVAAEELGADGAYFRVHHFARQLGSPFPLLAAVGARTSRIEIGTAVIDMRYENPLYMAAGLCAGRALWDRHVIDNNLFPGDTRHGCSATRERLLSEMRCRQPGSIARECRTAVICMACTPEAGR